MADDKDYKKRARAEQKELAGRIKSLRAFVRSPKIATVDGNEAGRLNAQLAMMDAYNGILIARIAHFK